MLRKVKHLSYLLLLLTIGCTKPPVPKENLKFEVRGSVAITAGQQGTRAQFLWREYLEHFEITLFGPLNVGTLSIEGNPHLVKLTTHRGKTLTSKHPDELVERVLGWPLPVQGLFYWLQGKTQPNSPSRVNRDPITGEKVIFQDGWEIHYTKLYPTQLPHHIRLIHQDITLRMVLKDWKAFK